MNEPDWSHPKIQHLIGSKARLEICLSLIKDILEGRTDFTSMDMEYWDSTHDEILKLKENDSKKFCKN